MKPKIADFGISKMKENTTKMSTLVGSPVWMAPELWNNTTQYNNKIDVYAFGIVFWEIIAREIPFQECRV
jgi:serine/threonine protein kinase